MKPRFKELRVPKTIMSKKEREKPAFLRPNKYRNSSRRLRSRTVAED